MENVTETKTTFNVTAPIIHGYARCSTSDEKQDIGRQVRELEAAGAGRVWVEYVHGDDPAKKELRAMLEAANKGDTILALEVSRLARSVRQLCDILETVRAKGLRLEIIGGLVMDCRGGKCDPMAEAFAKISGVFAELELQITRERVRSGMANAKAKGSQIGRPPIIADTVPAGFCRLFIRYQRGELNMTELARLAGISRPTAYRWARALAGQDGQAG